ncbi:unnamed protein product [Symbiodinium sp. CCMP2592]|nr:unnamed protein product [Symbiodinium sp. CCMP2592]
MMPTDNGDGPRTTREQPASTGSGTGDFVRCVQKLVNNVRRSEQRLRKQEEEREQVDKKWTQYQKELKASFMSEWTKHRDLVEKIKQETVDAQKQQETAVDELYALLADPKEYMAKPATLAPPPEAMAEWARLMEGTAEARAKLLAVLEGHRKRRERGTTPPKRSTRTLPITPPATTTSRRTAPTDADGLWQGLAGDEGPGVLRDPWDSRGSGRRPWMDQVEVPDRQSATEGEQGRKPVVAPSSAASLASKLERSREAMMEACMEEEDGDENPHTNAPSGCGCPTASGDRLEPEHGLQVMVAGGVDGTCVLYKGRGALTMTTTAASLGLWLLHGGFFGLSSKNPLHNGPVPLWSGHTNSVLEIGGFGCCDSVCSLPQYGGMNFARKIWDIFDLLDYTMDVGMLLLVWGVHLVQCWGGAMAAPFFFCLTVVLYTRGAGYAFHMEQTLRNQTGKRMHTRRAAEVDQHTASSGSLPTDIEIWCSGQLTREEQAALALQSSRCRVLDNDDLELEDHEEDEATVHVSFRVFSPHYETESVDIALEFPLNTDHVLEFVRESARIVTADWLTDAVFTRPQLHEDYGSIIVLPCWQRVSDRIVMLIDAREMGQGVFAFYHRGELSKRDVLYQMEQMPTAPVDVYVFGEPRMLADNEAVQPVLGGVIKVVPQGRAIVWASVIAERLTDPRRWNPNTEHLGHLSGTHFAFQTVARHKLHQVRRGDGYTPLAVASEIFDFEQQRIWVRSATQRPYGLYWKGRRVHTVIAVVEEAQYPQRDSWIVTLDLRGIGLWPIWVALRENCFFPGDVIEALDIRFLPGYSLVVRRTAGLVFVDDGELLEAALRPTGEITPTPVGEDEDSESGSSDTFDALPNSSDLSGSPAPDDGVPQGPPPPEPVNRPRSRSRGRQAAKGRPICLADAIGPTHYDMTQQTVHMPHDASDVAQLLLPWHTEDPAVDLSQPDLKPSTTEAVRRFVDRDVLFGNHENSEIAAHIYSDGSWHEPKQLGGYAIVVVLVAAGMTALYGVFGERTQGNDDSIWDFVDPPALKNEQVAIAVALLWLAQGCNFRQFAGVTLHYDCKSAGLSATGEWVPVNPFAEGTHVLESFLIEINVAPLALRHVKAHAGDPYNELADTMANLAALQPHRIVAPPSQAGLNLLRGDFTWLATHFRHACSGVLPFGAGGGLQWSQRTTFNPPTLSPQKLILVQPGWGDGGWSTHDFSMKVLALNAQSLSGKHHYFEQQLEQLQCNLACFQEAKRHAGVVGVVSSSRYLRLSTESQSHWGTSVWISKTRGLLSKNQRPCLVQEADIRVVAESPRILALAIDIGGGGGVPVDLNGRVPTGVPGTTGALAHGDPDDIGHRMCAIAKKANLWFPSTYRELHPGCSTTYLQANGTPHRIDYWALGGRASIANLRSWVDRDFDTANLNEDHFPVAIEMDGRLSDAASRTRLWRPKYDGDRILTGEGKQCIAAAMRAYTPPQWLVHPSDHCQHFQDYVHSVLRANFSLEPHGPRATYVREQALTARAFYHRQQESDFGVEIKRTTSTALRPLRDREKAGVGGRRAKEKKRPLPALKDAKGQEAAGAADRDKIWLKYFGDQEFGVVMRTEAYLAQQGEQPVLDEDIQWQITDVPSIPEIEAVLRQAPRRKAVGLDGVPGEFLAAAPHATARALLPLFAKTAVSLTQPAQWRGGILQEAWKGSEPCPFSVKDCMDCTSAPDHMHQAIRRRESVAVLFLDSQAAYYRVIRELCVGQVESDRAVCKIFEYFHIDPEDAKEFFKDIANGGMLADAGFPAALRHQVKDVMHQSWFVSRHGTSEELCYTRAGSRPGSSWADLIYAFVLKRILAQINETAVGEQLLTPMDLDMARGPFDGGAGDDAVEATDTVWADDVALPVSDGCPVKLMKKASRLTAIVVAFCHKHGMLPNLKPKKTALIIALRGRGARSAKQQWFPKGKKEVPLENLGLNVQVAGQYVHLGGLVDPEMKMTMEARRRLGIARASFDTGRDLFFTNKTIPLLTRASLFRTYIVATFFNLGLWIPAGKGWQLLDRGFTRVLKNLLSKDLAQEDYCKLAAPAVHILTDTPQLGAFARKARLGLLGSLVKIGSKELWAVLQEEKDWLQVIVEDLCWLCRAEPNLPEPTEAAWPQWHHLWINSQGAIKRAINKALAKDFAVFKEKQLVLLCLWGVYRRQAGSHSSHEPRPRRWVCRPCARVVRTKAALGAHFFKVHKRKAQYRSVVEGTLCRACGRQYWSRARLEVHLRASRTCANTLRNGGARQEAPLPGIGSRGFRAEQDENFTVSVPVQQVMPMPLWNEEVWDQVMRRAHAALCDALLSVSVPTDVEDISRLLCSVLGEFPLHYCEAQSIVEHIGTEIREIYVNGLNDYWTSAMRTC